MRKPVLVVLLSLFFQMTGFAQVRTLDDFIRLALSHSPLLKDYQWRLASNRIDSLRLRAGLAPQVNAVSNDSYAPMLRGIGQDDAITNGANLYAAISVSKEIVGRKNLQNQLLAIENQKQSILNPIQVTEQELKKNVTDQYISVFGLQRAVEFSMAELEILQKEERMVKQMTLSGTYKQTDYLTFRVQMLQQEMLIQQLHSRYKTAYRNLNYLCGVADTTTAAVGDPKLILEKLPELQRSVFYHQFLTDSLSLAIQNRQVDYNYHPKLSVFGDLGINSSLAVQPMKNFGPNIGLNLSIPLYDGHQRKMQHDQLALAEETRKAYRDFFAVQYNQQISTLMLQLQDNLRLIERVNKQVSYSAALVEANRKLLENGQVSITDYLLALTNLLSIKNQLIDNEIEKYQLISQLNYWSRESK
ncbi:MAG: TolC family protein [Marinilabiliales bacterium]|nr:TolC family protein [Marinilabiliales bacterium]